MNYPVADIFISKQGEGHFVGYRMAFVRLAGCSVLSCRIREQCDEAPWRAQWKLSAKDIVWEISNRSLTAGPFCAVCITGGEPTDHDLIPLICELRTKGWPVHLETSGVRSVAGYPLEWITVSPKTDHYVQRTGHALKLVVSPEWEVGEKAWSIVKSLSDGATFFHYYLQPLYDGDNPVNLDQVKTILCDQHNGRGKWALSWQAHKAWAVK